MLNIRILYVSLCLAMIFPVHARAGEVIATIKPLHSLAAAVMEGTGQAPVLLVDGNVSPHGFALRPSQVKALSRADIVFYIGDDFELFMARVWSALPDDALQVPMDQAKGITLYDSRYGGEPELNDDGDDHGFVDLHIWLSPANAKAMAAEIAQQLSMRYPAHAGRYAANAKKLLARLDALDAGLRAKLRPVKDKPFVTFHDAYQYFEKAYGLRSVGVVTLRPDQALGARHIYELKRKIQASGARCVFREPSFEARIITNVLEEENVKSDILDPDGTELVPGPDLYFQLMEAIAKAMAACLA